MANVLMHFTYCSQSFFLPNSLLINQLISTANSESGIFTPPATAIFSVNQPVSHYPLKSPEICPNPQPGECMASPSNCIPKKQSRPQPHNTVKEHHSFYLPIKQPFRQPRYFYHQLKIWYLHGIPPYDVEMKLIV